MMPQAAYTHSGYVAWTDDPTRPLAEVLANAITAYVTRVGRHPTEALVGREVLAAAHAAAPALRIEGHAWVEPGQVLLR